LSVLVLVFGTRSIFNPENCIQVSRIDEAEQSAGGSFENSKSESDDGRAPKAHAQRFAAGKEALKNNRATKSELRQTKQINRTHKDSKRLLQKREQTTIFVSPKVGLRGISSPQFTPRLGRRAQEDASGEKLEVGLIPNAQKTDKSQKEGFQNNQTSLDIQENPLENQGSDQIET
jgi:hypothetical protein